MAKKRSAVVVVPQGPSEYQLRSDTLVQVCVTLALVAGGLDLVRSSFGVVNTVRIWMTYPATDRYDELAEAAAAIVLLTGAILAAVGLQGHVRQLRAGLLLVGFGGIAAYVIRAVATFVVLMRLQDLLDRLDWAAFSLCQSLECVFVGVLALVARRRVGRRHPDDE